MNKLKLEVLLTALCLFIGLGAMFGSFALADADEQVQQFDPMTLRDMEVIKQGVCDIEAVPELSFLNGRYICALLVKDDTTMYTALFDQNTQELLYVIEFKKNGEEVETNVVWRTKVKAPPCVGLCT